MQAERGAVWRRIPDCAGTAGSHVGQAQSTTIFNSLITACTHHLLFMPTPARRDTCHQSINNHPFDHAILLLISDHCRHHIHTSLLPATMPTPSTTTPSTPDNTPAFTPTISIESAAGAAQAGRVPCFVMDCCGKVAHSGCVCAVGRALASDCLLRFARLPLDKPINRPRPSRILE